ncbi:nuclease-related domain-containing protein [Leifsonia sp. NPDC102414]|uniref:nuclease-related domain-containing protein n=1 Tax=Leifsonia sp. NPDC102414 TaxID=3364124 RepID=UPI00382E3210
MDSQRMRDRVAGYAVMEQVVRLHDDVPPRSAVARAFGVRPVTPDARPWFAGALGEREVGATLDRLPDGWTAFHALPVGSGDADIDHLVVGPGGVFAVNTKNHSGAEVWVGERAVLVNGAKKPYLRNSEFEASRIRKVLATAGLVAPVNAVVAVVGAKKLTVRQQPARVAVLSADGLNRWLTRRPSVIDAATVAAIVRVVDDPATWRGTQQSPPPERRALTSADTVERFDAIAREDRSARVVRLGWLVAIALSALAVSLPFLPGGLLGH